MRTSLKLAAAAVAAAALTVGGTVGANNDDPPGPDASDPQLLEPGEIGRYGSLTLLYPPDTLADGRADNCLFRLWALNHSNQPIDVTVVGTGELTVDTRTIPAGGQITLLSTDYALLDAATDANTTPLRAVWADGEQAVASLLDVDRPDGCWTPSLPSPWDDPERGPEIVVPVPNPRVRCVDIDGRPVCRLRPVG